MGIGWLIIALSIGFIFVIIQNKKHIDSTFYKNLNLTQLENELFRVLDDILDKVEPTSDFSNVAYEDFEAFDKEISNYKAGIIDYNAMRIDFLKEEFSADGGFKILSDDNGWTQEFESIKKRFNNLFDAYINY
jgi:hypothetical protein